MKRSRVEIARAVLRLHADGAAALVPVGELLGEAGAKTSGLMVRWIVSGSRGVWLDGLHRPTVGWMTTRAAVGRFRAERAARAAQSPSAA